MAKRAAAKRHTPWNLPPRLLLAAGLLILPIALPWALVSHHIDRRRLRAAIGRQACPACAAPLDPAALAAAQTHREAAMAALHKSFPAQRHHVGPFADAICGGCGAHLRFDRAARAFVPADRADDRRAV